MQMVQGLQSMMPSTPGEEEVLSDYGSFFTRRLRKR